MLPTTIAIDGPAASGKSTVGEALAERLGYLYFDTGVMYRAVTWAALDRGIAIEDEASVTALAGDLHIEVTEPTVADGRQYTVLADGIDITYGSDIGDVRVGAMLAFVQPDENKGGLGFGLAPYLDLPTGNHYRFLGQPGVTGGGVLALALDQSAGS